MFSRFLLFLWQREGSSCLDPRPSACSCEYLYQQSVCINVYLHLFFSERESGENVCMMRAQVGHQVTPLLNNSSSLPAGALEDSRSYSTSQNRTTTKWRRSAKSPNTCLVRCCLTGQSLSVLQTVEWARVWSVISSRLLQRCLSINIMNIAPGLLVRVAGSQHRCLW